MVGCGDRSFVLDLCDLSLLGKVCGGATVVLEFGSLGTVFCDRVSFILDLALYPEPFSNRDLSSIFPVISIIHFCIFHSACNIEEFVLHISCNSWVGYIDKEIPLEGYTLQWYQSLHSDPC